MRKLSKKSKPQYGKRVRSIYKPYDVYWAPDNDPEDHTVAIATTKQVFIYENETTRTYTVRKYDHFDGKASKERVFKTEPIRKVQ